MRIVIPDQKLRGVLSSKEKLRQRFGEEKASKLMRRISELFASANFGDFCSLPQTHYCRLDGNRKDQIALNLIPSVEVVLSPSEHSTPALPDGSPNWPSVTHISILDVTESKSTPTS